MDSYSLHSDHLLIFAYCKKRHLWGGLRAALIYGHKDMDLGDSLILCFFTEIVIVGSPIGTCEGGLTSNQKSVSYFHGICTTTVPMSMSCHVVDMFISAYANWASTTRPDNSLGSKYTELHDSSLVSKEASLEACQVWRFWHSALNADWKNLDFDQMYSPGTVFPYTVDYYYF